MTNTKTANDPTKLVTAEFRVSYPSVFKARANNINPNAPAKYELTMLFPKSHPAARTAIEDAINAAVAAKWGAKVPKGLKLPIKDGDEKESPEYAGHWYLKATSTHRPGLVNADKSPIAEDDGAFYAGCYARAQIRAYAYDQAGNRGVSFDLQNVQKLRDGEPFSGRDSAEEAFDAVSGGGDSAPL